MKKLIIILTAALLFQGCSVWKNFTTYFNLYYNTSAEFENGEELIKGQKRDIFLLEDPAIPSAANQSFIKVIEKASRILQFHSTTGFVDDALLMLGKSFYYQQSYQKAQRKFQELLLSDPNSSLALETRLWIGKTDLRLKNYNSGLSTLAEVREEAMRENEDEIVRETYLDEMRYFIHVAELNKAIELAEELIVYSSDRVTNALIQYQIGIMYRDMKDIPKAIIAFQDVFDFSPDFDTEFLATLELGRALREGNQADQALSIFEDLNSQDKFRDNRSEIIYQIGNTHRILGNYEEAISNLMHVDTAFNATPIALSARYRIAQIYEEEYKNYDSALSYYQRSISGQGDRDIIVAANNKTAQLKKYNYIRSLIIENEDKLFYIENPEAFIRDSIDYYDSLKEAREEAEILAFQQQNLENTPFVATPDTTNILDNPETGLEGNAPALSEGSTPPLNTQGDPPRRGRGDISQTAPQQPTTQQPGQPVVEKKPPIRPIISADSASVLIIKNHYDMGNLFLTELQIADSAYHYYSIIRERFPNSAYEGRVLFALAGYYASIGDNEKGDSLYKYVYENFRSENIVNAAAAKLKMPLIDLEYDPAKELYANAEAEMLKKNFFTSMNMFLDIWRDYPASPLAPKALYASGWILENELSLYDSAVTVYDSILTRYPQTAYASNVRPKVSSYKQEMERVRMAREDSIRIVQQAIQDSLNARETQRRDSLTATEGNAFEMIDRNYIDSLSGVIDTSGIVDPNMIDLDSGIGDPDHRRDNDPQYQQHMDALDSLRRIDNRGEGIDSLQRDLKRDLDSLNPGVIDGTGEDGGDKPPGG